MFFGTPPPRAESASAAAWLPDDGATTPFFASSSVSEKTAFVAPRILNEPVFCKFSHLKKSCAPAIPSSEAQVSTPVRWICGATRFCAARIAARSGVTCEVAEVVMVSKARSIINQPTVHYGTAALRCQPRPEPARPPIWPGYYSLQRED